MLLAEERHPAEAKAEEIVLRYAAPGALPAHWELQRRETREPFQNHPRHHDATGIAFSKGGRHFHPLHAVQAGLCLSTWLVITLLTESYWVGGSQDGPYRQVGVHDVES
jgi:hypothetical protein